MIYISDLPSALIINFINLFIFLFCYAVFAATFYLVIRARKSYFSLNPIILHAILLLANLILWSATRGKFQYVVILPWFILLIVLIAAIKLKILSTYSQTNLLTNKIIVLLSITTLLLSTYFNVRYHIMGLQFTSDIASKNGDLGISRTSHMLSSNNRKVPSQCGIENLDISKRIAIDESTLFLIPFRQNVVMSMNGISGWCDESTTVTERLRFLDVSAFIVSCSRTPGLIPFSIYREGDICCGHVE